MARVPWAEQRDETPGVRRCRFGAGARSGAAFAIAGLAARRFAGVDPSPLNRELDLDLAAVAKGTHASQSASILTPKSAVAHQPGRAECRREIDLLADVEC